MATGPKSDDVAEKIAKIGYKQAIALAVISGAIALSTIIVKDLVIPALKISDVQREIKNEVPGLVEKQLEKVIPEVKLFPAKNTKRNIEQPLGDYQICTLVTAGETHHDQACRCILEDQDAAPEKFNWRLKVRLDESVNGVCNCQAACFNFRTAVSKG